MEGGRCNGPEAVAAWRRRRSAAAAAAAAAQGHAAVAAVTPVGLLPRPSMSSHSRGRRLLSFLK